MTALAAVSSVWLGSMLAYTAASKFADYRRAGAAVSVYGIVPAPLVTPVGLALPWIEATAAALLLTGRGYPVGAALTAGLAFAFATGALYAIRSGADIDCGCAGERSEKVTRKTVLRAIAMALGAILVLVVAPGPFGASETTLFALAGLVAAALQGRRPGASVVSSATAEVGPSSRG